jgi:glycosyltransferase involved in cell wall biosynthesis
MFADEKAHRYPAFLRPLLEKIELAVLKRADVIIANGQDTADHYRKLGLTVSVIPNAVDLDRWRIPTARIGNPIDVLFVGRLTAVKGIDDFVAVARMASERHIEGLRFHVVGGPPVPIVEKAQMDGCLLYEGGVPNAGMPRVLSRSDACVALTYVRTGTDRFSGGAGVSNALLEQMAAGRLIIAWDNVAFRQVLDEDSAFLVPQGDREAILDALIKIRASPEIAERRAVRAAKVAEQYSFDRHLALFVQAAAKWMPARLGGAKLAPAEDV